MTAYQIALVKVTERTPGFMEYVEKSAALLASRGTEYIVRGPAKTVMEGDYLTGRAVIVSKWSSLDDADSFFNSDEYQKDTKPLREGSGIYDIATFDAVGEASSGEKAGFLVAIARIDSMTDALKAYIEQAANLSAEYGAQYIVRGPAVTVREGEHCKGRSVVISKFESVEKAEAFYNSDAYLNEIKPLRDGTGEYDVAIFEGA